MKPRVIHILNRLNIGGIVPQVLNTVQYLQNDFEVLLLSGKVETSEAAADYLFEHTNVKPVYISEMHRGISLKQDWLAYKNLKKIIKDFRPAIVHTHAAKPGALGRLAAYNCKVPVIIHTFHGHVFHSYFDNLKTRFFIEIEKWLAKKSTRLIAISKLQKQDFTDFKICPPERIEVISNGYELMKFYDNKTENRKKFRAKWHIDETDIVIGIVGRIVPVKNHTLFLRCISQLKKITKKNIKAIIIGDGESRLNMENLADELELSYTSAPDNAATLIFTSWIQNVSEAYAALDIACLSSLNEGTPTSLIEAQAAEIPIASTDVGGVRDTVLVNENVQLSPSDNEEKMVKNLLYLIDKINTQSINMKSNREFVIEKFGVERMVEETKQLYLKLIHESN